MKLAQAITVFSILCFGLNVASAGSMQCGTHLINDSERTGQSQAEVEKKCGAPKSRSGDSLYYKIGNVTYRLHFNDSDQLESISEEIE